MESNHLFPLAILVILVALSNGFTNELFGHTDEEVKKGCGNTPADVVFVLDESGSIWNPDFIRQLDFVKDVINVFNIGFNKTHIGIACFATDTRVIMDLGEFTEEEALMKEIDQIEQERGQTYTAEALRVARQDMLGRYQRSWVSKVVIVITDGESANPEKTAEQGLRLKETGAKVFAIGVGESIIYEELRAIASEPSEDYVYTVQNYASLASLKNLLGWKACQVSTTSTSTTTTTTTTPTTTTTTLPQMIEGCYGHKPIDVIFSVSDQAGIEDWGLALDFINIAVEHTEMSPDQVQAGLAPRNCFELAGIRLKDNEDKTGFQSDVAMRKLESLGTFTDLTLSYYSEIGFSSSNGAREESAKVAVMIIDNQSADLARTLEEAERVKASGIDIIVIGVGDAVNAEELALIASDPDEVFLLGNYEELFTIDEDITRLLCLKALKAQ